MFILFHERVSGPLANSLFHRRPDETLKPASIESAFHKADRAIQQVLDLLAAVKIVRDEFSKPAVLETSLSGKSEAGLFREGEAGLFLNG